MTRRLYIFGVCWRSFLWFLEISLLFFGNSKHALLNNCVGLPFAQPPPLVVSTWRNRTRAANHSFELFVHYRRHSRIHIKFAPGLSRRQICSDLCHSSSLPSTRASRDIGRLSWQRR